MLFLLIKMKKLFILIIGVALLGIVALFVFSDTKDVKKSTVKDVIENAATLDRHDVYVVLNGTIASQISKKRFWFEDETGQIVLQVDPDILDTFTPTMGAKVEVRGEVNSDANTDSNVEINVQEIIVVDDEEDVEIM